MVNVIFLTRNGEVLTVEAKAGTTLMEAARDNGIKGVVAECGGACSCATCHVYVDDRWIDKLPEIKSMEADMLEFASNRDMRHSRLSCQITLEGGLDGLVARIPAAE
jgi:ferredoxin, 2Fe-2S